MRAAALPLRFLFLAAALLPLTFGSCRGLAQREGAGAGLVHSVYFTLREDSPEARARLVADCRTLAVIDGVETLEVGVRDESQTREVNDQEFDVALTVGFRDAAALARYIDHPVHQQLLAKNGATFAKVRVFDADVRH